jgi:hypothetical protein
MRVVKTFNDKGTFQSGQDFIRGVDNNIENEIDNDKIKAKLNKELSTPTNPEDFKLWARVLITPPSETDKIRYENFIMGYFHRHDQDEDQGQPQDHSVYFKWNRVNGSLLGRIFVSPLLVEHVLALEPKLANSLVGDAAADATDPPSTTTPPPPLNGVGSSV